MTSEIEETKIGELIKQIFEEAKETKAAELLKQICENPARPEIATLTENLAKEARIWIDPHRVLAIACYGHERIMAKLYTDTLVMTVKVSEDIIEDVSIDSLITCECTCAH
ncbi:MAG: hypothetical protein QXT64_07700 [Desulfurococcaceae archaeon]